MTVGDQARVFLAMALCGGMLGAVYDALGLLRRGAFLSAAADLFFGLCTAGSVIVMALILQCEPFRLYVLLGVLSGFALYCCSMGTIVRFLMGRIRKLSKKAVN